MTIVNKLLNKNMRVREIPKWGVYLRKEWENHFANHLKEEEKSAIHMHDFDGFCGYLWHLFSFGKRDCVEGQYAIEAFHKEPKGECYVFYQHDEQAYLLENARLLNYDDLIDEESNDLYVVDKQFRWTFVITHETGWCGPYFSKK